METTKFVFGLVLTDETAQGWADATSVRLEVEQIQLVRK